MKTNRYSYLPRLLVGTFRQASGMRVNACLVLAGAAFVTAQPAHAVLHSSAVSVTASDAGVVSSTLQGTSVINFNSLATAGAGDYSNLTVSNIGTIDQVDLQGASQYGGANYSGGQPSGYYPVQGTPPTGVSGGSPISSSTLTLGTPSAYFGLWLSGGNQSNTITFYDGNTLVAQYNTATLLKSLPSSYLGNPKDGGADSSQPFAFLNFYAQGSTEFTKVVLSNPGATGFESDNWTVRTQAYGTLPGENPRSVPGVSLSSGQITPLAKLDLSSVPEPSTTLGLGLLILSGLSMRSRRRP